MQQCRSIVWFRHDLRLSDNPALAAGAALGPVLCVYVHDEISPGPRAAGGASRWWLHHSLARLAEALARRGGALEVLVGAAEDVIVEAAAATGANAVFWSRRYGEPERRIDAAVKASLVAKGIAARSFNASLLREPWELKTQAGAEFKVFTPFWKAHLSLGEAPRPLPVPANFIAAAAPPGLGHVRLDALDLLPRKPDWSGGLAAAWTPGEAGAQARLSAFLDSGAKGYAGTRDRADLPSTSRLAPHLRFGEISPRQLVHAIRHREASGAMAAADAAKFLAELGWREFCYHLFYHFPDLATRNFQARFDAFPWTPLDLDGLRAWQEGRTGYPIVDAGMRELWRTGFMHNRVRMICASFLTKHLLVDWRIGETWFWDTLCCADPASNPANWQWVAGSGADAAPYFRIFNPILQGQKFDPNGDYVRRHVPELAALDTRFVHQPWAAPAPPANYPKPIVDHDHARRRALAAFASLAARRY